MVLSLKGEGVASKSIMLFKLYINMVLGCPVDLSFLQF